MRDLGKALNSPDTQTRVRRVVESLKNHTNPTDRGDKTEMFSMAGLYRKAQKEGIESTYDLVDRQTKDCILQYSKGDGC